MLTGRVVAFNNYIYNNAYMTTDRRSPKLDAYMRFLHLRQKVDALPNMGGFGVNERALFEVIALAWAHGNLQWSFMPSISFDGRR